MHLQDAVANQFVVFARVAPVPPSHDRPDRLGVPTGKLAVPPSRRGVVVPLEDCAKGATGVATVATPMLPRTCLRKVQLALSRRRAVQVAALGALWRAIGCAKHACGKRDSADGLRDLALCLDRIRIM